MAGQEPQVELMQKYPLPQSPDDVKKYLFMGYGIFGICVAAVTYLTLYFM